MDESKLQITMYKLQMRMSQFGVLSVGCGVMDYK